LFKKKNFCVGSGSSSKIEAKSPLHGHHLRA